MSFFAASLRLSPWDVVVTPEVPPPRNGSGTAALVLGLVAVVFGFVPIVGLFIAAPSAPLALALGLIGVVRAERGVATNKRVALAGSILGGVASVAMVVVVAASVGPVT